MALAQPTPTLPESPGRPPHSWQTEETLVEQRRRKLRYRVARFFDRWRIWIILGVLTWWTLTDVTMARLVREGVPYLLRFFTIAALIIGQFALMFWFLGRTRQYTIMPGAEGVSFKDYRGQPELLAQAKQIVMLLRGVKAFEQAGGEPLNGLLLEGPPGTGKTWLAQAISTEAGVPFYYVDASSMNSMFVGIAPLKVSGLYRKARRAAKEYGAAIIFIDEIDAVGSSRAGVAGKQGGDDHDTIGARAVRLPIMFGGMGASSGLLSTLLLEMSGFSLEHGWWARQKRALYKLFLRRSPPKPQKRVLTIGATNRIQVLDPALLRPGRFDKKIRIDAPDLEGRRDIIEYYLSKMAHDGSIDPLIMATETPGYTPADLKYLLNEALRHALFDGRTAVGIRDIRMAQPEHEFGLRQPIRNMTLADKRRLCAHEGGHAIALRIFMPYHRIARITVIRQGGAHGYVLHYPATEEFQGLQTYDMLMARLRVSLGGKAGELEYCGEGMQSLGVGIGFGDGSDFGQSRLVLQMMAAAGMFGAIGATWESGKADGEMSREMVEAMEETMRVALDEVRVALRLHRQMGEALIDLLMEKNELYADEVEAFFNRYGYYTPKVRLTHDEPPGEVIVGDQEGGHVRH